eukprot:scaffold298206_cov17-Tisochrysis_lutea.AAC.1
MLVILLLLLASTEGAKGPFTKNRRTAREVHCPATNEKVCALQMAFTIAHLLMRVCALFLGGGRRGIDTRTLESLSSIGDCCGRRPWRVGRALYRSEVEGSSVASQQSVFFSQLTG